MKATAYSYVRFSHPDQIHGDSIQRQTELRDAWLAKNKATLDTTLNMQDQGVSAYLGKHRDNPDRHALAAFLALVEANRIERGSFLIVESLDRLSREHIRPALTLLLGLIEAGIRVVQLLPTEAVYDENVEPMALMMAIMELTRGHSESRMKSERIGRAWTRIRVKAMNGKRIVSARLPGWIRLVGGRDSDGKRSDGGKLVIDQTRAKIVRRIFQLAEDGCGVTTVVKRLNADHVPTFQHGRSWSNSTVYKLLTSQTTIGVYTPHTASGTGGKRKPAGDPIPGYYPAVIKENQFWTVQQRIKNRRAKGGRPGRDKHINIFGGMIRDARDGGSIVCSNAKSRPCVLIPSNARDGIEGSVWVSFPLPIFETAVLQELREIDPAEILGDEQAPDVVALSGKLAEKEGRIEKLKAELETTDEIGAIAAVVKKLERERAELLDQLAQAKREKASPKSEAWGELKTLVDALDRAADPVAARMKLRATVQRLIEWVYVLFCTGGKNKPRAAFVEVQFMDGVYRQYVIDYHPGHGNASANRKADWKVESWLETDEVQVTGGSVCGKATRAEIESKLMRRIGATAEV